MFLYPRKYLKVKGVHYLMDSIVQISYDNQTLGFDYQGNSVQITEVTAADIQIVEMVSGEGSLLPLIDQ